MKVSHHAKDRLKERVNIGKSDNKIQRIADKAFERGYTHSQTKGKLNKFMNWCFLKYNSGNNMRVYAGYLYIFNGRTLITVIPLPPNLQHHIKDFIKEAER